MFRNTLSIRFFHLTGRPLSSRTIRKIKMICWSDARMETHVSNRIGSAEASMETANRFGRRQNQPNHRPDNPRFPGADLRLRSEQCRNTVARNGKGTLVSGSPVHNRSIIPHFAMPLWRWQARSACSRQRHAHDPANGIQNVAQL